MELSSWRDVDCYDHIAKQSITQTQPQEAFPVLPIQGH